jgi:uncharacterized DUF497 family protein
MSVHSKIGMVEFDEPDPKKAARNFHKHGVTLEEGKTVLYDDAALTVTDNESDPNEERFVTLGMSARGERAVQLMKPEYDFSRGKRGAVAKEPPLEPGKSRITIRVDDDTLERFFQMADQAGTGYQTLINSALREYLDGKAPKFETTLRRIIREELARSSAA